MDICLFCPLENVIVDGEVETEEGRTDTDNELASSELDESLDESLDECQELRLLRLPLHGSGGQYGN